MRQLVAKFQFSVTRHILLFYDMFTLGFDVGILFRQSLFLLVSCAACIYYIVFCETENGSDNVVCSLRRGKATKHGQIHHILYVDI